MANLKDFLIVYNRLEASLVTFKEFSDSELATKEFIRAEHEFRGNEFMEVLLLSSDSDSTLQKTHGHYFSGKTEKLNYKELLGA